MLISQLPIISEKRKKTEMIEKRVVFELIREALQWGSQTSALYVVDMFKLTPISKYYEIVIP